MAKAMNTQERYHANRLAEMGCLICGSPANIHHVHRGWEARDHKKVAPLCPYHHIVPHGIHGPNGRERTDDLLGFSLEDWSKEQWIISLDETSNTM